jgi:uncharacterized protein (UPF0335 family)
VDALCLEDFKSRIPLIQKEERMSEAQQGHNSIAKDQLRAIVERIERLEENKSAIASDIRDVYVEAKSSAFDVKAIRTIVRMRKQDAHEREEQETILETYMHAMGMLA